MTVLFVIILEKQAVLYRVELVKNSWLNPDCFTQIQARHQYWGYPHLYVYASNIIAWPIMPMKNKITFLEHIASLKPTVSIHTNLGEKRLPDQAFYFSGEENNGIIAMIETIKPRLPTHRSRAEVSAAFAIKGY